MAWIVAMLNWCSVLASGKGSFAFSPISPPKIWGVATPPLQAKTKAILPQSVRHYQLDPVYRSRA